MSLAGTRGQPRGSGYTPLMSGAGYFIAGCWLTSVAGFIFVCATLKPRTRVRPETGARPATSNRSND